MLPRWLIALLVLLSEAWSARRDAQIRFLKLQVEMLQSRLPGSRVIPGPDRHAPKGAQTPWRKFMAMHMNVMVACDFFCKAVWTPLGKRPAYVLAFILCSFGKKYFCH